MMTHKIIPGLLMALLLLVGLGLLTLYQSIPRTAYVRLHRVYEAFELKKDLEAQLLASDREAQFTLDSLDVQLQALAAALQQSEDGPQRERYQALQQQYAFLHQQFKEDQNQLAREMDEKIWTQLNQYVDDYAEEWGLDYLIGADGSGTIMGGRERLDATEPIIEFINRSYHGFEP
ncbi:MAG: OmpH family outer membrane protein [Bacteroidota bacterium]